MAGLSLTEGPGVTAASGTHRLATHFKDTTTFPNAGLNTFAGAYANGNYFQFGLTVQPGYTASLATIDEVLRRSSGAAPGSFLYVYSFDNFASADEQAAPRFAVNAASADAAAAPDLTTPSFTTTGTNANGDVVPTVELSGFANLQSLSAGTTVTFRELAYTSTTTTNSLGVGQQTSVAGSGVSYDLALGGSAVAVPEPASAALLATAAAAAVGRRRRRRA